jgi:hypothetical protein
VELDAVRGVDQRVDAHHAAELATAARRAVGEEHEAIMNLWIH